MSNKKIAGLRSIKMEMKPGRYFWCACGFSIKQPFCDGSHNQGKDFKPLEVKLEQETLVKWCTCKHTLTPPWCDHSHRNLPGYTSKT
jgi:CDGSH-type Zn-finger protein